MSGETPWDVNELDDLCSTLGISFVYVATGIKSLPSGGGGVGLVPPPGLEPGTCGLKVRSSTN